ncbi:hypothetical protein REPUB_Repub15cG0140300 [Reevesia pubescens]
MFQWNIRHGKGRWSRDGEEQKGDNKGLCDRCLGPVSLSHKDELDKAQRGNKASINEQQCLKWLDSQEPNSVIYACLGSISSLKAPQLIELSLGLKASSKPFIWVLRGNDTSKEVEKWIKEDGFEV